MYMYRFFLALAVAFGLFFGLAGCDRVSNPIQDVVMAESDILDVVTPDDFKVRRGDRLIGFSDEISYGDSNILGALSLKSTEDVEVEGLKLSVSLRRYGDKTDWRNAIFLSDDDIDIENIRLRVVSRQSEPASEGIVLDDRGIIRFRPNEDGSKVVERVNLQDGFILPAGQSILVIHGDLGPAWDYLGGARLGFTLDVVRHAEGVISEKDYTDPGEFFSEERRFLDVKIVPVPTIVVE